MSRVGKKQLEIPSGVTVSISGNEVTVKGPKGELKQDFIAKVEVAVEEGKLVKVAQKEGADNASAFQGLYRQLIKNMIEGVTNGFSKSLEVVGVGYKVQSANNKLTMNIGYNKPVEYLAPTGIKIETPSVSEIVVSGIDKQKVGQVAAEIRAIRKPEPYKGKGVRYKNEVIRRKAGKAVGGK